jgi:adenine-specific DNA-methyltransferase
MSYRYLGNKTRLLPHLMRRIGAACPPGGRVADLMTGTASVAAMLRERGYAVTALDLMTFSVQHARVRLLLDAPPAFAAVDQRGYAGVLAQLNALPPAPGYVFREYGTDGRPANGAEPRKYLSGSNAASIDAIRAQIAAWERGGRLAGLEADLLRHDLVLATNRVANIAGTYGHFRSTFSPGALRELELRPTTFAPSLPAVPGDRHRVLQGAAEDLAPDIDVDVCYIDPPYIKRQYAANYHLIETLARGDEPEAAGVSGLRPWRDQYSDFCSKVRMFDSFRTVLGGVRCRTVFVSYSEDGLASPGQLEALFGEFGRTTLESVPLPRFRSSGHSGRAVVREFLFRIDMVPARSSVP